MQQASRHWKIVITLLALLGLAAPRGVAQAPAGITLVPQDGFNFTLTDLIAPTYAVLAVSPPTHGWFAGTFTNLPTETPVTLGFSLDGNDDTKTPANVTKWVGLRPVMTYADPTQYASYVSYAKDAAGQWVADDPFRTGADRLAGTGAVPIQEVMSAADAAAFLSADGTTWSPWREVDQAQTLTKVNVFRMTQQFTQSTATVAMRVPYTYTYLHAFLAQLAAAHYPGVTLDTVGQTREGRALTVIRLEPPAPATAAADRPTILVYAREHATEPDSSWVAEGMLTWLLSDDPEARTARRQCDWLLMPLLDPDHATHARYRDADLFRSGDGMRPEALALARYVLQWVDQGHAIALVMNLHNVECTEGPNVFTPILNPGRLEQVTALKTALYAAATDAGYTTGTPGWAIVGWQSSRLAGWCSRVFGACDLLYETNSRVPTARLDLPRLRHLGAVLARELARYRQTPAFAAVQDRIAAHLAQRHTAREAWRQRTGRRPGERTTYELMTLGY